LSEEDVFALKRSRTLPLLVNLLAVTLVAAGMIWKGAFTDFKVHGLIESVLSIVTLFIIGICIYLRRRGESRLFLIIGLTFAGGWVLELWHTAASLEQAGLVLPLASEEFKTASWLAPRLYLGTGLLLALFMAPASAGSRSERTSSDIPYYLTSGIAIVPAALISLMISSNLYDVQWGPISRPEDFVLAPLFIAVTAGWALRGIWRRDVFEYYLLFFLLMATAIHLAVMPISSAEFDSFYAVAHLFKFAGTVIVLVGLVLYGRDTSSELLEDEIQRAETMLQTMDDGILVMDENHAIKSANPAACEIFGFSEQTLLGQNLFKFLHGLKLNERGQLTPDHFSKRVEIKGSRSDGSEFPLEITFNLLPSKRAEGKTQILGVMRDISERQAREIERINLNRQLETALKAAGLGRWVWNTRTLRMTWDDQCDKIYGLPAGCRGMTRAELADAIHPEDATQMNDTFTNVAEEGRFRDAEFRIFRREDGSERWIAMSGTKLVGEGDADDRVVGVLRDVTSYKTSVQELTEAREAADEASQVKSAFLANMSHEIRTPMNGVVGMLDVLQQSRLNSKQTDMVNVIKESAFSLLHLIDDILDFSKIEAGKLAMEIAPLDVAAVTESVCASLELLAQENGVELALFTDPRLPQGVMGDSLRIRQVLVNLVNNAIKFSKDNTRTGKVSIQTTLVEEDTEQARIELRVDDNGIGMTQEVQDAVFDIFVQADSSTSRKFGGTGLGLTISKNLVEMMGGEIDLYSVPGEGSTFTVRVTLPKTELPDAPPTRDWHLQNVECLLLEEPSGYSDHLATYLTSVGARVEQVSEVTEALQWLNADSSTRRVCVVDGGATHLTAVERKLLERDNLGVVVIQRERRQLVTHIQDALVHNGNAMNKRHFLQLVAVAAGAITPETQESSGKDADTGAGSPTAPSREEAIARNALILVAEDNLTNQQVVMEQLTVLGYHAEIANNGVEGLEKWREGCYSLLLTDLQMPKMDGYSLAAAIRDEESDGTRIPIVALSADALVGEAERSAEVGMDDYLSKPARLDDLKNMLAKWLEPGSSTANETADAPEPTSELPILDIAELQALIGSDESRIQNLLQAYRNSLQGICGPMIDAWQSGDHETVGANAHQLKSSSLSIGALRLGNLAADIEATARNTQTVPPLGLIKEFETQVDAIESAIPLPTDDGLSQDQPA